MAIILARRVVTSQYSTLAVTVIIFLAYCIPVVCPVNVLPRLKLSCVPFALGTFREPCHCIYTEELKIKYKDRLVDVGTKYSIWQRTGGIFVWFYDHDWHQCTRFIINALNGTFHCRPQRQELEVDNNKMFCIGFGTIFATDLIKTCSAPASKACNRTYDSGNMVAYYYGNRAGYSKAPELLSLHNHERLLVFANAMLLMIVQSLMM